MREVTATEARRRFGRLLDAAQTGPVRITRNGRGVGVLMSVGQFERLRGAAWETLAATMDASGHGEHGLRPDLQQSKPSIRRLRPGAISEARAPGTQPPASSSPWIKPPEHRERRGAGLARRDER